MATVPKVVAPQAPVQKPVPHWRTEPTVDDRVYRFVIGGRILQGVGFALALGCTVAAFVFTPLFLLGYVGTLLLSALGTQMARARVWPGDNSIYFPGLETPPFIAGQPVGLYRQGQNCCINAALQVALASPSMNAEFAKLPEANALRIVRDGYETARRGGQFVADVATQSVRQHLTADKPQRHDGLSPFSAYQADAGEVLGFLFEEVTPPADQQGERPAFLNKIATKSRTREGEKRKASQEEPRLILNVLSYVDRLNYRDHRKIPEGLTCEQVFINYIALPYFIDQNDNGVVKRKFAAPPRELFVQLTLFDKAGRKVTQPIPVPLEWTVPDVFVVTKQECRMEADAFFVHRGSTPRSGHFVAYVKDTNGTWWEADDYHLSPLSLEEAESAATQAYNIHYRRVRGGNDLNDRKDQKDQKDAR